MKVKKLKRRYRNGKLVVTARDRLALRIRQEHTLVGRRLRDMHVHARKAGALLNEAKEKMSHGYFGAWLRERCDLSHRTANYYMLIAREWPRVEANSQHIANSSLGAVARWLSAGSKARAANAPLREKVRTLLGEEERATKNYGAFMGKLETVMTMTGRLRNIIAWFSESETQSALASALTLRHHVDDVIAALRQHVAERRVPDDADIQFALSDAACDEAARAESSTSVVA